MIRNFFLTVLILAVLAGLIAADWYVRFDPSRKARRMLEAQEVPMDSQGAIAAAQDGNLFNLEQLEAVSVDLGRVNPESGETPLMAAIRVGRGESIDFLLQRETVKVSLDAPSSETGENALVMALKRNDFGLAGRLVEAGANPDVRFDPEIPLMVQAIREKNEPAFDFLIASGVDPNPSAPDGISPLALAVEQGNGNQIHQIVQSGGDVNVIGTTGDTLLLEALARSDHDLADVLLNAGADPNAFGASGQTALLASVKAGRAAMARMLLDYGADPNLAGKDKKTPMEIATQAQDVDLMAVLIEAGADVTRPDLMKTAFGNRDLPGMSLLLRSGAEPEVKIGRGRTLLDEALSTESELIARTLLEAGASAKGKLWSALGTGNERMVDMVLRFGADVGEKDPERGLPLNYALKIGHGGFVATFLSHGANPNLEREDGESWLAAAIREGNEPVANALLDHGACSEGIGAGDGHSLLGWAIAHQMTEVAQRLIEDGADVRAREPSPASDEFIAAFERSKTFRWHLKADSKLNPLHLAAAQGDAEIARALIEAGAKKGDYSRRYLWPVNIAAWHMDVEMMQIILGRDPDPAKQPRKIIVDLGSQRATLYENGKSTYSTRVSTGKSGYRTPAGKYVITDKHRHHNSSIYGSSMPYFMRLSCAAFGLHQGYVPSYPASHGCIRVPQSGAKHLFSKCEVGDRVDIVH